MTNKEIDKLLSMLDTEQLDNIKKFLLEQKEKNIAEFRQKAFEKYLTTNKYGMNIRRVPKLCIDDNTQRFTNGVSLYIINNNFFNTRTAKLMKGTAKGTWSKNRFEYIDKKAFMEFVSAILPDDSYIYSECSELVKKENDKYTYVDYKSWYDNKNYTERFDTTEIELANILLNNPKYLVAHNMPLLKAESNIGKAYILGFKHK